MSWTNYERDFKRAFPRGSSITSKPGGGIVITVPCKGGHEGTQEFDMRMPPEKAKKHMANKGWLFWGSKTTCPNHAKRDDEPMRTTNENTPAISEDARTARRLALLLLDEQFDVTKGSYRNGYSDAKVASEIGLSVDMIAKLRDEFYGPIREPAEFAEFRTDLAALSDRVEKVERDGAAVFGALKADLRKLADKIDATVRRNGW